MTQARSRQSSRIPIDLSFKFEDAVPVSPGCRVGKKNRAHRAAKSREETPKEGIYSQRL